MFKSGSRQWARRLRHHSPAGCEDLAVHMSDIDRNTLDEARIPTTDQLGQRCERLRDAAPNNRLGPYWTQGVPTQVKAGSGPSASVVRACVPFRSSASASESFGTHVGQTFHGYHHPHRKKYPIRCRLKSISWSLQGWPVTLLTPSHDGFSYSTLQLHQDCDHRLVPLGLIHRDCLWPSLYHRGISAMA